MFRMYRGVANGLFWKSEQIVQGGLLGGEKVWILDKNDPLQLWIMQAGVIIFATQMVSIPLRKIQQPKVIAEIIGGIILGPTVMGRVRGFTDYIFPTDSRPYLSLIADIGLCLFLFLIGLEVDRPIIGKNAKFSATVAFLGMIIPFGFGAALAVPIYNRFIDHSVSLSYFIVFVGIAYSITAFAILCRVLTELKLLNTTVGLVAFSAGFCNDVVGFVLLALCVTFVNASSRLTALWILLVCLGWSIFMLFPVKYAFRWLAIRTGSTEKGPTTWFMTFTVLVVLGSALFTDAIGVHFIFGAFLAGVIVPREGGLPMALTEKLEDVVCIVFLPLYFTLSGLSTDLGLLNDSKCYFGITWAYTVAICVTAFLAKFGGVALAARVTGFTWRESGAIGSLMSCKGLVELIVLRVGLSAGIISQRVFSMFVVEAVVLTFVTVPVLNRLYPPECRGRVQEVQIGRDSLITEGPGSSPLARNDVICKTRFTMVLDKVEHLPGVMALMRLVHPVFTDLSTHDGSTVPPIGQSRHPFLIDGIRIDRISDSISAVMKSTIADAPENLDPLLEIFRRFGELNDLPTRTSSSVAAPEELAAAVAAHASETASDMILIPCLLSSIYNTGTDTGERTHIPIEHIRSSICLNNPVPTAHSQFIHGILLQAKTDVAMFIHKERRPSDFFGSARHIILPFFGGWDDRLALHFVMQLCAQPKTSATVIRMFKELGDVAEHQAAPLNDRNPAQFRDGTSLTSSAGLPISLAGEDALRFETDETTWIYARQIGSALPGGSAHVEFTELRSPAPLHTIIQDAKDRTFSLSGRSTRLLVVIGWENHGGGMKEGRIASENEFHSEQQLIGDAAMALIASEWMVDLMVMRAKV